MHPHMEVKTNHEAGEVSRQFRELAVQSRGPEFGSQHPSKVVHTCLSPPAPRDDGNTWLVDVVFLKQHN